MRASQRRCAPLMAVICVVPLGSAVAADVREWIDPKGDAVIRRTDIGVDGPIQPVSVASPHDILKMSISGWSLTGAPTDPYTGTVIKGKGAHLFRFDLVMDGLVNPPGTLGEGGQDFNPFQFGTRPLYGFIEFDLDHQEQVTGGECTAQARNRYAANVGRFGRMPYERAEVCVQFPWDLDDNFATEPKFELSGSDFSMVFCGCWPVTIKSQGGNGNGIFDPGETWVVTGRFFQRAGGFQGVSQAFASGFPFTPGMYDPFLDVRFSHNASTNQTTITLVYALDMEGAKVLANAPTQEAPNAKWSDQNSVFEALYEFINSGLPRVGCAGPLVGIWDTFQGKGLEAYSTVLDVTKWEATALVGVSYSEQQEPGTVYAWTDTAGKEVGGDIDGDGFATANDLALVFGAIASYDGVQFKDCDGLTNGAVTLCDFGPTFSLYDINYNGVIEQADADEPCYADCDGDNRLDVSDVICFQTLFAIGSLLADCDGDLSLGIDDFICFQTYFAIGC